MSDFLRKFGYLKNKDIIWCPSDPDANSNRDDAKVSYFYKAAVDQAWYGDGNVKCRKEGDFDFAADQVVFYEHNSWHWGDASKGFANGVTLNMAYMDGHVAAKRIVNTGGTASFPANPGEPCYFNYPGGQTDPAPAAPPGGCVTGRYWNPHTYYDYLP